VLPVFFYPYLYTMEKFEVGKTYRGVSGAGEVAITINRRTEKSVWIDTCMDKEKRCLINTRSFGNDFEAIMYKSWLTYATDEYSLEQQRNDAMYAAYHR